MKNLILAAMMVASVAVAGCQTTSTNPATGEIIDNRSELTKKIQDATAAACSFIPTAQTLANLAKVWYAKGGDIALTATQIADDICDAIQPPRPTSGGGVSTFGTLHGVPLKGQYVK